MNESEEIANRVGDRLESFPVGEILEKGEMKPVSVYTLLEKIEPKKQKDLATSVAGLERSRIFEEVPILGVCGSMMTGKSSLVAAFLSEEGAARTLCGDGGKREVTDRFTLWLPQKWASDEDLKRRIEDLFLEVFGQPLELLSEDPEQARAQQNLRGENADQRSFFRPLLAFDPGLNDAGIAFLDCPDIQSAPGNPMDEEAFQLRKEALAKAAGCCPAFVVVTSMEQLGGGDFGKVLGAIAETGKDKPVFLAVNKLREEDFPEQSLASIQERIEEWNQDERIREIYGAVYDLSNPPKPNFRDLRNTDKSFVDAAEGLQSADLYRRAISSALHGIIEQLTRMEKAPFALREKAIKNDATRVWKSLTRFLSSHFFDESGKFLRPLITPPEVAIQIQDSFSRTAPGPLLRGTMSVAKPLRDLNEWIGKKFSELAEMVDSWIPWVMKTPKLRDFVRRKGNQVEPAFFADELEGESFLPPKTRRSTLKKIWEKSLDAAMRRGREREYFLEDIDDHTARVWEEIPAGKRMAFAAILPLLAISTVVLAFFVDPTGGLGGVFVANLIEVASGWGLAYLANSAAMGLLQKELDRELAIPQLSDLHALLCDSFGLPRADRARLARGSVSRNLSPSRSELPGQTAKIKLSNGPYFHFDESGYRQLIKELKSIDPDK